MVILGHLDESIQLCMNPEDWMKELRMKPEDRLKPRMKPEDRRSKPEEPFFPFPLTTLNFSGKQHVVPFCYDYKFPKEKALDKTIPLDIVKGKRIPHDVYDLLSASGKTDDYLVRNNGDIVNLKDAISGNYVVICCFFVPMSNDYTGICRALIAAYSELKRKGVNFEMVMVAKMRKAGVIPESEEEAAFDHFFSAFPCLAVPFSHNSRRNMICDLVGLGSDNFRDEHHVCLILDPDQNVLQKSSDCFYDYGAAAFPFTDDHLHSIYVKDDEVLKMRLDPVYRERRWFARCGLEFDEVSKPLPLEELLCCEPSTILESYGGDREISVSELSKSKCVFLYLCYTGNYIEFLKKIHKKCVDEGKDIEIVVVPFVCYSDESTYFHGLNVAMNEYGNKSWWMLRSDMVSRRLYRLIPSEDDHDSWAIWVNGGRGGELLGRPLMDIFGDDAYYPYTRNAWLDNTLATLRSLTLESVVGENVRTLFDLGGISQFKNQNTILFFLGDFEVSGSRYNDLYECSEEMKKKYPDSQVVYVPLEKESRLVVAQKQVQWPILCLPAGHCFPSIVGNFSAIVFGADNQVKSLCRIWDLRDRFHREVGFSLFDDNLRRDMLWFLGQHLVP